MTVRKAFSLSLSLARFLSVSLCLSARAREGGTMHAGSCSSAVFHQALTSSQSQLFSCLPSIHPELSCNLSLSLSLSLPAAASIIKEAGASASPSALLCIMAASTTSLLFCLALSAPLFSATLSQDNYQAAQATTFEPLVAEIKDFTTVATPPAAAPTAPPAPLNCTSACAHRCSLNGRPKLCIRACQTCCYRCKCVPPGTAGNHHVCGTCYNNQITHGGRSKCP